MTDEILTVKEADGQYTNFATFHPEISLIKPIMELKDREIILIDAIVMENYPTPRGPRDTVLALACFSNDQYGKGSWFKFIESARILSEQVQRWRVYDPKLNKNKFPVKGVLVKEYPSYGHKYTMWFLK